MINQYINMPLDQWCGSKLEYFGIFPNPNKNLDLYPDTIFLQKITILQWAAKVLRATAKKYVFL
jgi:hypothetical protein